MGLGKLDKKDEGGTLGHVLAERSRWKDYVFSARVSIKEELAWLRRFNGKLTSEEFSFVSILYWQHSG